MAQFDKAIPPGGEGKIQLRVETKGYQGYINKSARVATNDPGKKQFVLRIKAFVKVPVYVSARYIRLYGKEGQEVTKVAEIRAELDKPLELSPADFTLSGKLKYTIEEIDKGRKYNIRFASIPGAADSYSGSLKLKTNYPEKPEIIFVISGRFDKPRENDGQKR